MLTTLSIRNVVLIDALDLDFGAGLRVLTGETGAGKSILLDALGLVLGARADTGLVRHGTDRAEVTAAFDADALPPALTALLDDADLVREAGEPLILRRALRADGGSRAFVNDRPVSAALLREIGALLIEIHGQHDDRGLLAPAGHRALLDAFARSDTGAVAAAHAAWQAAETALAERRAALDAAERDRDFLTHAVAELTAFAPAPGEEAELATARAAMQAGERIADDLSGVRALFDGSDSPSAQLRGAARRLDRFAAEEPHLAAALAALDRALVELDEAEGALAAGARAIEFDPERLDAIERRLFDLRALSRKYGVGADDLAAHAATLAEQLAAIEGGAEGLAGAERAAQAARDAYAAAAAALSAHRRAAAVRLDAAVAAELVPLKLDAARFATTVEELAPDRWSADGADRVEFRIATNPGAPFGPLAKIASGGELSRFVLALKVALADEGGADTIIFDEIDRGVGGAVAAAIGDRLARLASDGRQVLVVTHSPQVAARGAGHLCIAKSTTGGATRTAVRPLNHAERTEEIARMLSGAAVTDEARAQAARLLERAD